MHAVQKEVNADVSTEDSDEPDERGVGCPASVPPPKLTEPDLDDIDKPCHQRRDYFCIEPSPRDISDILGPETPDNDPHCEQNHAEDYTAITEFIGDTERREKIIKERVRFFADFPFGYQIHQSKPKRSDERSITEKNEGSVCQKPIVLQRFRERSGVCCETV